MSKSQHGSIQVPSRHVCQSAAVECVQVLQQHHTDDRQHGAAGLAAQLQLPQSGMVQR